MSHVAIALFVAAAFGLLLHGLQLAAVVVHRRARAPLATRPTGISILKPLCGVDDDLARNLEQFAALDYAPFELLLGVRDRRDPAYPVAIGVARRHPRRVRVVLQREPVGLNPKVNQLATLARAARYELLVVSDSNTRVADGWLDEIGAHFEDARVGLVTHPVVGVGEARLGALLDNLHLTASIGAGMIGAKRVVGQDVVVGKSMALRRGDLAELGGFAALGDVLAEDYILGRMVARTLEKRVVVARTVVLNVSQRRRVRDFFARYQRWSVIHRQAIGVRLYACEILLNPIAIAALATLVQPRRVGAFAMVAVAKLAYEAAAVSLLRGGRPPWRLIYATPLKDALVAAAWAQGLWRREIDWRGSKLRVLAGTRLARPREFARNSQSRAAA